MGNVGVHLSVYRILHAQSKFVNHTLYIHDIAVMDFCQLVNY